MLIHGYAKLAYYDSDLMVSVATSIVEQISDLTDMHLTNLMHSYAVLNVSAPKMFDAVVQELKTRFSTNGPQFPAQGLAVMLWSCAVVDILDRPLWDTFMDQLHAVGGAEELSLECQGQVFQSLMLCVARYPSVEWPIEKTLLESGEKMWRAQVTDVRISLFHKEVSRTLNAMGIQHMLEHLTEDGLFSSTFCIYFL